MHVIGIVGGVGSGKTLVATEFKRLGASVLDADQAGHEVLRDPAVRHALRGRWGDAVLRPDGQVDRRAVAQIVFASTPEAAEELRFLERWTHPRIEQCLQDRVTELAEAGVEAVVFDAPVMLKAGWDRLCDHIVFVDAPAKCRQARCRARGWTDQQWARREAAQTPLAGKRARADQVIDNSGSIESTRCQVEQLWYNRFGNR